MAFNAYLQIDGIKGESTDKDHKDWISLISFSHSISQATSIPSGGGAAGKVTHLEIVITKRVDIASPKLYEACATGKHFPNAVIDVSRSAVAAPVKYLVIRMQDVIISGVASSGASGNDFPVETVSLNYGSIQWVYTPQNPDGSAGTDVIGTWGRGNP